MSRTSSGSSSLQDVELSSDESEDRNEARKAKKDLHNSHRRRYKHYRGDARLYKIMRHAGHLLQVTFSTVLPFPADDEREAQVTQAFQQALQRYNLEDDTYVLSRDDVRMV